MSDYITELSEIANEISSSDPLTPIQQARADGLRLTSGTERPDRSEEVDPSTLLRDPAPEQRATLPQGKSGAASHPQFVHSQAVGYHHDKAREAARVGSLPASRAVAPTDAMQEAWEAVQRAWAIADAAVKTIPVKAAEAARERSRLAGQGDAPVALPSPQDIRMFWDAKGVAACQQVVSLRGTYDRVVVDESAAHIELLGESIPTLSADVLERVRDLEKTVRTLRCGVESYVEVAGNSSSGVMPARLPSRADLSGLAALQVEVEQLQAVAAQPSQPRIEPSLSERLAIIQRSQNAIGGLTSEVVDLARVERQESFAYTSHTKAYPASALESFARSQSSFLI